ncbi:MAG: hypothetical protein LIO65_05140, partial [Odoribacter sp.]|nr:hypothetical protein [Odoribacter sp.]
YKDRKMIKYSLLITSIVMKNKLISLFILLCVLFSACSDNKNGGLEENEGNQNVYLQMKSLISGQSRADEASQVGDAAPLLSALIYFMDNSADPVVYTTRTAGEYNSDITMTQLENGYEFLNIPSEVTQVYIVGNYNSSDASNATATFPTVRGTRKSAIEAVILNIQQVAHGTLANGSTSGVILAVMDGTATVQTYPNAANPWEGTATLADGNRYASVTISPLVSRIEIDELTYTGSYNSFTVDGIFINYFYSQKPVSLSNASADGAVMVNNSSNGDHYEEGNADFQYTYYQRLYDIIDDDVTPVGTGNAKTVSITPTNGTWAYHVFGNSDPVPHIIIRLTNVVDGTGAALGTRYVTVRGYTASTGEVTTFVRNTIYRIANLAFTDEDISPIPEPEFMDLWVSVTVADWILINVSPII